MIDALMPWVLVTALGGMVFTDALLVWSLKGRVAVQNSLIDAQRKLIDAQRQTIEWRESCDRIAAGLT